MALTKVAPYVVAVSNNITSTTIGGAGQIPSLTFDGSGVITSASNTALTVANTAITGLITATQLANTGITAGVYGGASNAASITVDAQGRVTSVSNVAWTSTSITGGFSNMSVFTANGTFTVPSGISKVKVYVTGGGGGAGTDADGAGNSGNTSSFGPHCSASGGSGGGGTSGSHPYTSGGVGSGGDLNFAGLVGTPSAAGNYSAVGFGGGTFWGATYGRGGYPGGGNSSGGGGGGTSIKIVSGLTSAQTITVTVGTGGTTGAGAASGANGVVVVEY